MINPLKIIAGIFALVIILTVTVVLLKQNSVGTKPSLKPATTKTQTEPASSQSSQVRPPVSSSSASKVSSSTVPLAERHSFTFADATVVGFEPSAKVLTLSTKEKPAWQITIDNSIRLYKDRGFANLVAVPPGELTKGLAVSVQQEADTGNIVQITVKPSTFQ